MPVLRTLNLLFPGLLVLICGVACFGQPLKSDTSFIANAKANTIARYSNSISAQSHLYNGSAYTEYISQRDENPYFIDEWLDGTVTYDGEYYTNVPVLYDITTDRVIIDNAFSIKKVMLVNEKVSAFTIQDHRFVHLRNMELPEGHYEITYDGAIKVYVHHRKSLQSRVVDYSIINEFEEKKLYYIYKDATWFPVKGKGSVLKVLEGKKKELKKFIRDNRLQFRNDRARDISRVAQFYDQLK
jgi:hypothetical protein